MNMVDVSHQIDKIFSRKVLGSILFGGAVGKVVEKVIILLTVTTFDRLIAWFIAAVLAGLLYIYWNRIESATDEVME